MAKEGSKTNIADQPYYSNANKHVIVTQLIDKINLAAKYFSLSTLVVTKDQVS